MGIKKPGKAADAFPGGIVLYQEPDPREAKDEPVAAAVLFKKWADLAPAAADLNA
jgi:hypothetical protein